MAVWRLAGQGLPEDRPLSLAAGWNLVGYLPRRPLTVTTALEGIVGQYGAVLGFERTALSYYPGLDASYNTLYRMAPGYGYWVNAGKALTLSYPVSAVTGTVPFTPSLAVQGRQLQIRRAEWEAGVQPTVEWMNFYGKLALPDGTGVPTGTIVLAVDPQGMICGATATWEVGQYGLLACYHDDPDTGEDEGASPGDTIRLVVAEGSPPQPTGRVIGEGTWTAHGSRQQVPPAVDLAITKAVLPAQAAPGDMVTYTLTYSNQGGLPAQGVVISDRLPAEITGAAFTSGGELTDTVDGRVIFWHVPELQPDAGGAITVTGILSLALTDQVAITNTAAITVPQEGFPDDNTAQAVLQVARPQAPPGAPPEPKPPYRTYLPLLLRERPAPGLEADADS